MFLIPFALKLNAKLFAAFEKFLRAVPVSDNKSPKPAKGAEKLSKIPASFLTSPNIATLIPSANAFFQSILLNVSFIVLAKPTKNS